MSQNQLFATADGKAFRLQFNLSALITEAGDVNEALRLYDGDGEGNLPEGASDLRPLGTLPTGRKSEAPQLRVPQRKTDVQAAFDQLDQATTDPAALPEDVARVAADLQLDLFYSRFMEPWRQARLREGLISKDCVRNEERAVRRFCEWDMSQPPQSWPAGVDWPGFPLGRLRSERFKEYFIHQAQHYWRWGTCRTVWLSLQTVLRHAGRLGVISAVPKIAKFERTIKEVLEAEGVTDDDVNAFTDDDLGRIYTAIDEVVAGAVESGLIAARRPAHTEKLAMAIVSELKAAIVVGTNCGPRANDLLLLDFERHFDLQKDVPQIEFRARKTGKVHRVPLAPVTVSHLTDLRKSKRYDRAKTHVFPSLVNPKAKDPMDTRPKRRSTALLAAAVAAAGLDPAEFPKPFQSLRKSCHTRLNATGIVHGKMSIGEHVTHGKDATVSSRYYDDPFPTIAQAIADLGMPAAFG